MKKYDVVALGELLIDFTESGYSKQGNALLEVNPGGAPCNVLAMLQKLGKRTAFIGKVGQDQFGQLLKEKIESVGICADYLHMDPNYHTTLTFVKTLQNGDRDFSFYRNPGADMMLRRDEVCAKLIRESKILHFGTLSMTDEDVREATKFAIETAKESGLLLSFDPNLRCPLWSSLEDAKEQICYGLTNCDILKISEEELEFVTNTKNIVEGVHQLRERYAISLICVTAGSRGSIAFYRDERVEQPAYLQKNTIETTGAGDTFGGCVLNFVLDRGLEYLDKEYLKDMLRFANAAASIVTTRKGALAVMPTKEEVFNLICNI